MKDIFNDIVVSVGHPVGCGYGGVVDVCAELSSVAPPPLRYATDFSDLRLSSRWPMASIGSARLRLGGVAVWARVQSPTCVASVVHVRVRDALEYPELLERVLRRAFSDASDLHLLVGLFGGLGQDQTPKTLERLDVFQPPLARGGIEAEAFEVGPRVCVGTLGRKPVWCYRERHVPDGSRTLRRWRRCRRRRLDATVSVRVVCKV